MERMSIRDATRRRLSHIPIRPIRLIRPMQTHQFRIDLFFLDHLKSCHGCADRFKFFNGGHCRIVALLPVALPDGGRYLGAREVLKAVEVLSRFRRAT